MIIAAILKLPWKNNRFVRKDVCMARNESLKREIGELKERVREIAEDAKEILERMEGYDDLPFLEDVEFCKKAKKYGKLGQIDKLIITSPRRYHAKGKFRLTAFFSLAVFLNMLGLRPKFLYGWIIEK